MAQPPCRVCLFKEALLSLGLNEGFTNSYMDPKAPTKALLSGMATKSLVWGFFCFLTFYLFGCSGSLWLLRLFSGCSEGGSSPVAVHGLLIAAASLVAEHRLLSVWASAVVAPGLQRAGSVVVAHGLSCLARIFPD